jgi:hypothetical protein
MREEFLHASSTNKKPKQSEIGEVDNGEHTFLAAELFT